MYWRHQRIEVCCIADYSVVCVSYPIAAANILIRTMTKVHARVVAPEVSVARISPVPVVGGSAKPLSVKRVIQEIVRTEHVVLVDRTLNIHSVRVVLNCIS